MNACFSNMIYEINKPEIMKQKAVELQKQQQEQRKLDLLKGKPFNLQTDKRAFDHYKLPQQASNKFKSNFLRTMDGCKFNTRSQPILDGLQHDKPFINYASPTKVGTNTPKNLVLFSPKVLHKNSTTMFPNMEQPNTCPKKSPIIKQLKLFDTMML